MLYEKNICMNMLTAEILVPMEIAIHTKCPGVLYYMAFIL